MKFPELLQDGLTVCAIIHEHHRFLGRPVRYFSWMEFVSAVPQVIKEAKIPVTNLTSYAMLRKAGFQLTREYYLNNFLILYHKKNERFAGRRGSQIRTQPGSPALPKMKIELSSVMPADYRSVPVNPNIPENLVTFTC